MTNSYDKVPFYNGFTFIMMIAYRQYEALKLVRTPLNILLRGF